MEKLSIRPGSLVDAVAISRLILPLVKEFISHEYDRKGEQTMLDSMSPRSITRKINQGYEYFVALNEGQSKIIGVLAIKNKNHIYHYFVDKKHHRQAVAKQLWEHYLSLESVPRCSVNSSKYAIGFYQSIGFKSTDEVYDKQGVTCYPMTRDSNDS